MKTKLLIIFMVFCGIVNAQYTNLLNFAGATNGNDPYESLVSDGTFLYGMTRIGGTNNFGTIFKILPDGTGYVKLLDFAGATTGKTPRGSLFYDGTFLYGMTISGGTSDIGVIFKIMPDGTGFTKILDFTGAANGSNPEGSLISDGTFLYGMTNSGGINGQGVLFKIMPNGTGFSKLIDFAVGANGYNPKNSLFYDGTFLYGMTYSGGTSNFGVIFKIMPNGTGFSKLLDFAGATNGSYPYGNLISDGTFLYGMTLLGGSSNMGTIFKIMPNGTGYSKLLDFAGTTNGKYPESSLISVGTFLYGMTSSGGSNNMGTVFKIMSNGTGYSKLLDFAGTTNGNNPRGSFISSGSFLYGMTALGGTNNFGTVFKFCITPVLFTQSLTVCAGQSLTVGSSTYSASGTYQNTLTAVSTCDSIVTTNLTVLPANTFTQSPAVCSGQSVTVGSTTHTVSGTYTDVLTSLINGCDSTVTTNLTVLPANTFSQSPTVCSGQSVTVGSTTHTVSGTYTDVLASLVNGCDSTVTTNLTVLPANTFTQSPTVCSGQSVTVGSTTHTVNGTFTDVLTSLVNGCDSTVTTNLTVLPANTFTQSPTVCSGQSVTVGSTTHTVSGTYTDVLTSLISGCDSTVTTNLTVLTAITNSFTTTNPSCGSSDGSATASPSGGAGTYTFLWNNGSSASTVTGLTGLPSDTLVVIITDVNGCAFTDTVVINCVTGVNQFTVSGLQLTAYPNPFSASTTLQTDYSLKNATLTVYNSCGQKVKQINNVWGQTVVLHRDNLPGGLYFLHLTRDNKVIATNKLIITDN